MPNLTIAELHRRGTFRPDRHADRRTGRDPFTRGPIPRAPGHLSAQAKRIFRSIAREWMLDPAAVVILTTALEAHDRLTVARKLIDKEGLVSVSRRGAKRAHPALRVEATARTALLTAIKQLNLEAAK